MGNFLSEVRDIADPALPVDQAGHRMPLALRRVDDRSPIMAGDVVASKRNAMARQDMADCDAEGGPRKLDEGEYGGYMNEGMKNCKVGKRVVPGHLSESEIALWNVRD